MKILLSIIALLSSLSSYSACTIAAYEKVLFDDETSVYEQETLQKYKNLFSEKGYTVVNDAAAADLEFSYYSFGSTASCMLVGTKLTKTVRISITNKHINWHKEHTESTCTLATGEEFKDEKFEFKKTVLENALKKIPDCDFL